MKTALRVLLVEDSPEDAFLLAHHLEMEGLEVTIERVEASEPFREALGRGPWDVVISDYSMPRFSAPEALDVLKETNQDIPFIVVSGSIGEETAVAIMHAGAHDYVLKHHLGRLVPAIKRERREAEHRRLRRATQAENERLELERLDLLEKLKQENEDLTALTQITANAISTLDLEDLVRTLLHRVVEVMRADEATILLAEGRELRMLASVGAAHLQGDGVAKTIGEGFEGTIAATQGALYVDDGLTDSKLNDSEIRGRGLRSLVGVPLKRQGVLIGVLHAGWLIPRPRRERDVHMLEITAERCAVAIQNARLFSELRQALTDLRSSEERFRLVAETIDEVFWMTDPSKRQMLYISPGYETVWGRSCSSLYAAPQTWLDAIHPEDRDRVIQALQLQADGGYDTEYRIVRPDGGVRHVRDRAFPVKDGDGGVYRVVGVANDVTDRREAEAARLASEVWFGAIFEAEPECVKVISAGGDLEQINPAGLAMLEAKSLEDAQRHTLLQFVEPDYREAYDALRLSCLSGRSGRLEFEMTGLRGTRRWLDSHAVPLRDEGGRVAKILSVARDITEQRQAQESLRQALRDQAALLKEVHHRVKNNLQLIVSLLRLETSRSMEEAAKLVLRDMQGRIQSMALLHETLYRAGNYADVDLSSYLGQLGIQLLRTLKPGSRSIELDRHMTPVSVGIDQAIPCGLVLHELLSNCLKHAFQGMGAGVVRLELDYLADGTEVRLSVKDNGVGLPSNFAPLSGKSLGLQLVSDLARQLGGRLDVGPGPGATFTVTFRALKVERRQTLELGSIAEALGVRSRRAT